MDSILESIKKLLGVPLDDDHWDTDIIIHINTALSTLCQIGIGPEDGMFITNGDTTWSELLDGNAQIELVKTYVYIKVKIVFDPPSSSTVLESLKTTASELEWRANVAVDN